MLDVRFHAEVAAWYVETCRSDPATADLVTAAVDLVEEHGTSVGRPLVTALVGSRFYTVRDLQPGRADGVEANLLFAFGPERQAIFLVAGSGTGKWWWFWFVDAKRLADDRYEGLLPLLRSAMLPDELMSWSDVRAEAVAIDPSLDDAERRARRIHIGQEMMASISGARLEFGSILRRLMDHRRLSPQALTHASGHDASTIYGLLGGTEPRPEILHDIAPVLHMPVADLLAIAGLPTEPEPSGWVPYWAPHEVGRLALVASHLTADQVKQLIESARNLRAQNVAE